MYVQYGARILIPAWKDECWLSFFLSGNVLYRDLSEFQALVTPNIPYIHHVKTVIHRRIEFLIADCHRQWVVFADSVQVGSDSRESEDSCSVSSSKVGKVAWNSVETVFAGAVPPSAADPICWGWTSDSPVPSTGASLKISIGAQQCGGIFSNRDFSKGIGLYWLIWSTKTSSVLVDWQRCSVSLLKLN